MNCIQCGHPDCSVINEVHSTGKDFSVTQGCCGSIFLGPIGILCGACGQKRKIHNTTYWVCNHCGTKFKM